MKGVSKMRIRYDSKGHILIPRERERKDGLYELRFSYKGKRYSIYAKTLKQLRHIHFTSCLVTDPAGLDIEMKKLKERYGEQWVW